MDMDLNEVVEAVAELEVELEVKLADDHRALTMGINK